MANRNPRREILRVLRSWNKSLKWQLNRWDVTGKVWGEAGGPRPRGVLEYPENQPDAWLNLAEWARQMAEAATMLEGHARLMAADVQSRPELVATRREVTR